VGTALPSRIVQAIERQRVPLPRKLDTVRIRQRLVDAASRIGMPEALEIRRGGLYAGGAVGVIDIGDVAVEILPKTTGDGSIESGRAFLVDLLRFVGRDRGPFATAAASIGQGAAGLMEVLFAWAVRDTARHADSGIPRRYVARTEVSTAVRGRIDMKRVALARPGRDFELTIRHAPLSADSDIGKALRWLMKEVAARTRRPDTRRSALTLHEQLSGIADIEADAALFDRIILRPLEDHWQPLLVFGRSLAVQRGLDPVHAGGIQSVAVLFTLHDLFERALRRVLHDDGPRTGLAPARIPRNLLSAPAGEIVGLKPDYVFRASGAGTLAVADAKWKNIWGAAVSINLAREDAYQITSYMAAGRAQVGFLFAPIVGEGAEPLSVHSYEMAGTAQRFSVIGVHVATLLRRDAPGQHLRQRFCATIADTMSELSPGTPMPPGSVP
jgi:5-methylcytosine-specific restriction enzyme subunit McrC